MRSILILAVLLMAPAIADAQYYYHVRSAGYAPFRPSYYTSYYSMPRTYYRSTYTHTHTRSYVPVPRPYPVYVPRPYPVPVPVPVHTSPYTQYWQSLPPPTIIYYPY